MPTGSTSGTYQVIPGKVVVDTISVVGRQGRSAGIAQPHGSRRGRIVVLAAKSEVGSCNRIFEESFFVELQEIGGEICVKSSFQRNDGKIGFSFSRLQDRVCT